MTYLMVHLSGDLGQAIASDNQSTWLFEGGGRRLAATNEIRFFFQCAMEIVDLSGIPSLDDVGIIRRLADFNTLHIALRGALDGMDVDLSDHLRQSAINQTERMVKIKPPFDFVATRLIRSDTPDGLDPNIAKQLSREIGAEQLGDVYTGVSSSAVLETEKLIDQPSRNLSYAREQGLVANIVLADVRRDQLRLDRSIMVALRSGIFNPPTEAISNIGRRFQLLAEPKRKKGSNWSMRQAKPLNGFTLRYSREAAQDWQQSREWSHPANISQFISIIFHEIVRSSTSEIVTGELEFINFHSQFIAKSNNNYVYLVSDDRFGVVIRISLSRGIVIVEEIVEGPRSASNVFDRYLKEWG